jgi:hypothetical protein
VPAAFVLHARRAGTGIVVNTAQEDRFEPKPEDTALARGQKVILTDSSGARTRGRYVGTLPPTPQDQRLYYLVDRDSRGDVVALPADTVSAVEVKSPPRGWLYGGLIGLALDAATLATISVMYPATDF